MKTIKASQVSELAAKAAEKALQQRASAQGNSKAVVPPVIIGIYFKEQD